MFACKICNKKFTDITGLYSHMEKVHKDIIPKDMIVERYYYYLKTGKTNGNCVMCKRPTTWNSATNKYNRFCTNPKCKEEYVKMFKKRMIAKYGKVHLLNDPAKQREMLANRKISGKYRWADGTETTYTGSYELDLLNMLEWFFDWDPTDIMMPSPHTYTYKYKGEDKFYIPDMFIPSLDLEVEIKDGGDNPNMHYKIQVVDKEKEKLKDEVLMSQKSFHYIKITNKNYTNLFNFLAKAKQLFEQYGDEKKIPRIFMTEDIKTKPVVKPQPVSEAIDFVNIQDIVKTVNKKPMSNYNFFISAQMDAKKNDPEEVKNYILKLLKSAKNDQDIKYIRGLAGKSASYYYSLLGKKAINKSNVDEYDNWLQQDFVNAINKRIKKINSTGPKKNFLFEAMIKVEEINELLHGEPREHIDAYLNDYANEYHHTLKEDPILADKMEAEIDSILKSVYELKSKPNIDQINLQYVIDRLENMDSNPDNDHEDNEHGTIYESSISFAKINQLMQNKSEDLLAEYLNDYKSYYNKMEKEKPEAVKHINKDVQRAIKVIKDMKNVDNDLIKYALNELEHMGLPHVTIKEAHSPFGNVHVSADWHFYKWIDGKLWVNPNVLEIVNNVNRTVANDDLLIFLGDLYDARNIFDVSNLRHLERIKDLPGYKVMVKGNHDVAENEFYLSLGFDEVVEKYEMGNIVFTHEPVEVSKDEINVHGHLHGTYNYWHTNAFNHVDAWIGMYNLSPILVTELISKYRVEHMDQHTVDKALINLGFHRITENAGDVYNTVPSLLLSVVYDPSIRPRSQFTLNDSESKLYINDNCYLQRDIGSKPTLCIVKEGSLVEDRKGQKVVSYQVTLESPLVLNGFMNEIRNMKIDVPCLYKQNDVGNRFLKTICEALNCKGTVKLVNSQEYKK